VKACWGLAGEGGGGIKDGGRVGRRGGVGTGWAREGSGGEKVGRERYGGRGGSRGADGWGGDGGRSGGLGGGQKGVSVLPGEEKKAWIERRKKKKLEEEDSPWGDSFLALDLNANALQVLTRGKCKPHKRGRWVWRTVGRKIG